MGGNKGLPGEKSWTDSSRRPPKPDLVGEGVRVDDAIGVGLPLAEENSDSSVSLEAKLPLRLASGDGVCIPSEFGASDCVGSDCVGIGWSACTGASFKAEVSGCDNSVDDLLDTIRIGNGEIDAFSASTGKGLRILTLTAAVLAAVGRAGAIPSTFFERSEESADD